jgi:hypothetical protein
MMVNHTPSIMVPYEVDGVGNTVTVDASAVVDVSTSVLVSMEVEGGVAVGMLVVVSVVVKLTVSKAVDGGEYITMLTDTEVTKVVAVSVVMLVNVEREV